MLRMNMKLPVHKHLKRQLENEDLSFVSDSVLLIRTGAVGIVFGFFFWYKEVHFFHQQGYFQRLKCFSIPKIFLFFFHFTFPHT